MWRWVSTTVVDVFRFSFEFQVVVLGRREGVVFCWFLLFDQFFLFLFLEGFSSELFWVF